MHDQADRSLEAFGCFLATAVEQACNEPSMLFVGRSSYLSVGMKKPK